MSVCVWWVWTRDLWKPTERTAVSLEANDGTAELEDDCRRRLSIGDWTSSLSATITCSPSWLDYQSINFDSWPIRCRFIHFFFIFFFFSIFFQFFEPVQVRLHRNCLDTFWLHLGNQSIGGWLKCPDWIQMGAGEANCSFCWFDWRKKRNSAIRAGNQNGELTVNNRTYCAIIGEPPRLIKINLHAVQCPNVRNETAPLWLAVPKCPIRDVPDAMFPLCFSLAEATDDKKMAPGRNQLIHTPHLSVAYYPIDNGPTDPRTHQLAFIQYRRLQNRSLDSEMNYNTVGPVGGQIKNRDLSAWKLSPVAFYH